MRIAIDASRAGRELKTGTEAYSRHLIDALARVASEHRLQLYYDREPISPPHAPNVEVRVAPLPRLWTHARLSFEMLRARPDVLFVPAHVVPLAHPRSTVVTVHDLGYLRYRLAYRPAAWIYLFLSTRWNARAARRVIADSFATRRDLMTHCRLDPARIDVVQLGVEPRFQPMARDAVERALEPCALRPGYLLYLGTLQPRKNLPRLVRAYAAARERAPLPPLVLAGAPGHGAPALERLISDLELEPAVVRLGYVSDELLPALYAGAQAFLFPSLYEGFGLPLLEAMASGTPVLAGANSSMPEIVGDAGVLVDAEDQAAITNGLLRLATDTTLRRKLRERGLARAAEFTWERAAQQTLASLERAARS